MRDYQLNRMLFLSVDVWGFVSRATRHVTKKIISIIGNKQSMTIIIITHLSFILCSPKHRQQRVKLVATRPQVKTCDLWIAKAGNRFWRRMHRHIIHYTRQVHLILSHILIIVRLAAIHLVVLLYLALHAYWAR
jgi:hypothetical protein